MLSATLINTKRISLHGLKSQWKIVKDDEVISCGGTEYVKLCPRSYSLARLIVEKNSAIAEDEQDELISLARSMGYTNMLRIRNQQQAASFLESVSQPSASCTLFAPPPEKKARVIISRQQIGELRRNPQDLTIAITAGGVTMDVKVLRAFHPQENIFVEYEARTIAHVLGFIRELGFTEKREKKADLPEGIRRRGDKFVVRVLNSVSASGVKQYKYKTFDNVDDAMSFKLDDGADVDEQEAKDDGDVEDDHVSEG